VCVCVCVCVCVNGRRTISIGSGVTADKHSGL